MCKYCSTDLTEFIETEKAQIKIRLAEQTKPETIARELGISPAALNRRVFKYFNIPNAHDALGRVKKGEMVQE